MTGFIKSVVATAVISATFSAGAANLSDTNFTRKGMETNNLDGSTQVQFSRTSAFTATATSRNFWRRN